MSFDVGKPEFIKHLFLEKKLYHSLLEEFNDPFEGKPHYNNEDKENNPQTIRNDLIKQFRIRNGGMNKKEAEKIVSNWMKTPGFIQKVIADATTMTFNQVRVCSFTTDKENVLFWSHYAKSHTGICIEFDAAVMPISQAYKIHYSNTYPKITYPPPSNEEMIKPLLVKAKAWEYENEFRTWFNPHYLEGLSSDGESLLLDSSVITNIYLGAKMDSRDRDVLLKIISRSQFTPNIWQANLSSNSFKLIFEKYTSGV